MERLRENLGLGSILGLVGLGLLFGACSGGKSAADTPEVSSAGAANMVAVGGGGAAHKPEVGGGGAMHASEVGGGGAAVADNSAVSQVRSSKARVMPAASEAARATSSEQAFAFSFLHALPGNENLTFSPHSLSTAFAMLSDAAAGDTLQELQATLQFGTTDEAFHRAQSALSLALASRNHEATENGLLKTPAQTLTESNDIWVRRDAEPAASFLDTLAQYYGAGAHLADFGGAPEEARKAINAKVATDTHQLISELMPPEALDETVVAVLTNALYFKAQWEKEFAPPYPGDFHRLDGSTSTASMLNTRTLLPYYEGNGFVSVGVPYNGNTLSMLLVVPDANAYEQVREQLSSEGLGDIVAGQSRELIDLTLPTFELTSTLPATATLKELGLTRAFDENAAEFPKLESETLKPVHIKDVFHQATVAIDQYGTEASAATAIVAAAGGSSGPPAQPKIVNVDRPFLFVIRDNPTGSLLFVGQVVDPQKP